MGAVVRAPADFPSGKDGDVLTAEFTVIGIRCVGLNGGSHVKHNEAFSFRIATDDQAETDRLWNASWQITPRSLLDAISDPDRAAAKRAFDAMMSRKKLDIAAIEAARRG